MHCNGLTPSAFSKKKKKSSRLAFLCKYVGFVTYKYYLGMRTRVHPQLALRLQSLAWAAAPPQHRCDGPASSSDTLKKKKNREKTNQHPGAAARGRCSSAERGGGGARGGGVWEVGGGGELGVRGGKGGTGRGAQVSRRAWQPAP